MSQPTLEKLILENSQLKAQLEAITEGGGIKIIFPDKLIAKQIIRKINPRILKELPRYSVEPINSPNLILEGDNLHALASLYQYRNKVDLILTDPPYNTGKDFRYNDNQNKLPNDEELGDLIQENDSAKHTKWMKFMLPRLILMKEMLKDSGVLAICIDERELFNLGKMLDEIFGEENRVAIINWQKTAAAKNQMKHISPSVEYILVYAKEFTQAKTARLARTPAMLKRYKNPDNDPGGAWVADNPSSGPPSKANLYAVQSPFTGQLLRPPPGASWRWPKRKIKTWLEEYGSEYEEVDLPNEKVPALLLKGSKDYSDLENNSVVKKAQVKAQKRYKEGNWPRLVFLKEGEGRFGIKRYLSELKEGVPATNLWESKEFLSSFFIPSKETGYSLTGTRELIAILEKGRDFIGVKPLKLFSKIIQLWCPPNGLILDPFAGTGTTGHAVFELNQTEKSNRQFILIEQGNPKNGDTFARTLLVPRLKAVISGKWADGKEHEPLKGSFKYLKLTKQINSQTLLEMEKEELIDSILSIQLDAVPLKGNYLIAKNQSQEGIFLIWNGNPHRESQFTEKIYRQCALESKKYKLTPVYHIYARTQVYFPKTVNFHKIPDHLLLEFGINPVQGLKTRKIRKPWTK